MPRLSDFDKLVIHGCKNGWCWKLYCTTCGSMDFRNGMELIGMGQDPLAEPETSRRNGLRWRDNPHEIVARTLLLGCQVAAANVQEYCRQHHGIDWLGFMGLALWRISNTSVPRDTRFEDEREMENRELLLQLISNSWSRQFYLLFRSYLAQSDAMDSEREIHDALECCKQIIRKERPPFRISDLEIMEGGVIRMLEQHGNRTLFT